MVNNFPLIKPLLSFSSKDEFYFVQLILRKKDLKVKGTNNNSRLVKAYFVNENDNIFAQFKVEVQTLIDDLFSGDYSSPSEYTSRLIIQDPEIEFLLLDNKNFDITPHEWKELRKAIINHIDTHSYDDVQN